MPSETREDLLRQAVRRIAESCPRLAKSCYWAGTSAIALEVPVFAGILKHPTSEELAELLTDPAVVRKYTHEALRKAPWSALRRFPRDWLVACLRDAKLPDSRRRALELLLGI